MKRCVVRSIPCLHGQISVPGDKSIAHRSVIVSALARGNTTISNFPFNEDCRTTLAAFSALGVRIQVSLQSHTVQINGKELSGLQKPAHALYTGESGTTLRLLLGVLAGCDFKVRLTSGKSLSKRPMLRVTEPLRRMGAKLTARHLPSAQQEEYPPITITGGSLKPISYSMPVASAQVKSAILLAGLFTDGITRVKEPLPTRDHTERMLKLFGADIKRSRQWICLRGNQPLISPKRIVIPGDISSASFFMVLAAILPDSRVVLRNVSLNPSRMGIIQVLTMMNARIRIRAHIHKAAGAEPAGDIFIQNSQLRGIRIKKSMIPSLIDELPVLMVAAAYAKGKSVFEGVEELRVKETDRIKSMVANLSKMGLAIKVCRNRGPLKIIIEGGKALHGARVRSFGDHRTAMSMIVAGLKAEGLTYIDDITCINKSFPDFLKVLHSFSAESIRFL